MTYYAHTLEERPEADWEPLAQHLAEVGQLAAEFAAAFGAEEWARLAGGWHDLGKYSNAFQDYLRSANDEHEAEVAGNVDHSTAGARHAVESFEVLGHLLAFPLAGHHSGLLDALSADGQKASMDRRLSKVIEEWRPGAERDSINLTVSEQPQVPDFVKRDRDPFTISFFVRMLFSCLVDADFLCTEAFLDSTKSARRPAYPYDVLARMEAALNRHVAKFDGATGPVNEQRRRVREASVRRASDEPGFFSLTVPTGGGKTLSSLAFALRHALKHGLRRIVYVIPFTSIIEQNAKVFREALDEVQAEVDADLVVEHHSNFDPEKETKTTRLAAENWDAPLVVTTSVQFYESLFANRTSRCRKLHNLAGAVVILDEAQTIPVTKLEPCLRALKELTANYGASVVLCTATQPAIHRRDGFPIGLEGVREIVSDPPQLYNDLRRVRTDVLGRATDSEIIEHLESFERVLCVVNTRNHARELYRRLGTEHGHFHLSALMCAEHRSHVLEQVRKQLDAGAESVCRLVSTQLIEAGVDIDFPVVMRSMAGLDSIAQAAGRCNREGRLNDLGHLLVFRSEHPRAEAFLRETTNAATQVLDIYEDDPLSLDAVEHYFRLYYWDQTDRWDAKKILRDFHLAANNPELPFLFNFATAAIKFRVIEETGKPVIVPWGDRGQQLCEQLRAASRDRLAYLRYLQRRLQRFTVQVPERIWNQQIGRTLELVHERFAVLISPETNYSEATGLTFEDEKLGDLLQG